MKIALVHYWLVGMRGGESVLECLCELYPDADIITHVIDEEKISDAILSHNIRTTFISSLPFAKRFYQSYLPLMPYALESMDMNEYDLIISSESGPAKGIIPAPDALHICYCHSPMRYIWDMYHEYRNNAGILKKILMPYLSHRLRIWDQSSSTRVDCFIANSRYVARRIKKYYRRNSKVINPPVNVNKFHISENIGDYYLFLGELVPYKKADLAVDAFNLTGIPLVIVGQGPQFKGLAKKAKSNIKLVGRQSDENLRELLACCRGLVFPGQEDFGIVPLEAMASGRPVVAFSRGGALETVIEGKTGVFFDEQNIDSLKEAIEKNESLMGAYSPREIRSHAERFSREKFKEAISRYINECVERHCL